MNKKDDDVKTVREFVRKITSDLGLLNKAPYTSELNLMESRIIFELAQAGDLRSKDLAAELAIDKGYLSRIVSSLKKRKLISDHSSQTDRREKLLTLTDQGKKMFKKIDGVSNQRSRSFLNSIDLSKRTVLLESLSTARLAMDTYLPRKQREICLDNPTVGDLGWVINRHGEIYRQEYGWNQDFENLVAEIALAFFKKNDPTKERVWIAKIDGVRVGCIFLVHDTPEVAKLRLLLVEPFARGLGIGRLLVQECLRFAETTGYKKVVLWTNDVLLSARKIYTDEGFKLIREEKHKSFGKSLIGQYWERNIM